MGGKKSAAVRFVTKAADIKFHRQTRNPRVLGPSEFRLLFASNGGEASARSGAAAIGCVRMKNRARLVKGRYALLANENQAKRGYARAVPE